ncbi:MAG: DUF4421 family protein [Bacteroidota bacterium]
MMKASCKYFSVLILLPLCFVHAGNPFDTTYIRVFKQNYTVVTDIYTKGIDFSISPYLQIDSIDLREIKYMPNVRSYYGLSASYKGWGLGVSLKIPSPVNSDSIYGKTTFYDYKLSLHKRKFGGTCYLRYYKGFYLYNPAFFDTTWKGGVVPHRDDMEIATLGFNAYYLFNNKKFSMKSLLSQSERQRKSASSFILQGDVFASFLQSDSTLIPYSDKSYYQDLKGFQDMFLYSISVMGGYAYCWIIKKFYVCPMLFLGPGYQHKLMNADKGTIIMDNAFLKSDFKLAVGHNAEYVYGGMFFDIDSNFMPVKYANFKSSVFMIDFFIGVRFGRKRNV